MSKKYHIEEGNPTDAKPLTKKEKKQALDSAAALIRESKTEIYDWHTIAFGWILEGMRDTGKGELHNAERARQILDHLLSSQKEELFQRVFEIETEALAYKDYKLPIELSITASDMKNILKDQEEIGMLAMKRKALEEMK